MKSSILEKAAQTIKTKKTSKTLAICLSILCAISMLTVLATLPAKAATTNPPLSGAYWIMPVPADQSTGKVTQTETSTGVVGSLPGDVYGAYPTIADQNGLPYWDLTGTPYLSFDIYVNEFWQGDLQDHTGLSVIIVDQTNNGWNPSSESACDLSTTYGHAVTLSDGSIMRVANSASPTHYVIDLRTLGVPLNHISQLIWSIRPGMKGIACNYQISNIQLSTTAGASSPTPTPSPTITPTPPPTVAPTPTPIATPTPTPMPTPTSAPTPVPTATPTPTPAPTQPPTPAPTATPTPTPTPTETQAPTPDPTATPSPVSTPTQVTIPPQITAINPPIPTPASTEQPTPTPPPARASMPTPTQENPTVEPWRPPVRVYGWWWNLFGWNRFNVWFLRF